MADEETPPSEGSKTFTQADVDRIVESRLSKEKGKYADYAELKAKADQFDQLDAASKSDAEKLTERLTAAEKRAEAAESKALRHEVAAAKGLTPAQAKRLVGSTQEELEADADEILEAFPGAPKVTAPPSDRPKPLALRGGSDPSDEPEEQDPRKLANLIPRG